MGYSVVCLILGLIIGPLVERTSIGPWHGFGSFSVFSLPIAVGIIAVTLLFVGWPYVQRLWARLRGSAPSG
jgi:TctA family transporter